MSTHRKERSRHWETFRGWHREESLWREIYARTVSALIAAFLIFVVAAAAGFVTVYREQVIRVLLAIAVVVAMFAYLNFANNAIQRRVKEGRLEEGSNLYWLLIVVFLIPPVAVLLYSLSTLPP
jgi:Ca2+/Na+ antiporter